MTNAGRELRYRRARALAIEWDGEQMLLVRCATGERLPIAPAVSLLLSSLGCWRSLAELAAAGIRVAPDLLEQLHVYRIIERSWDDAQAADAEHASDAIESWHPFDLDALAQQPPARLPASPGPPPPAFVPAQVPGVPLPPPLPLPGSLADVLAARRSIRHYAREPISLAELSGLLHHAARVEHVERDPRVGEEVRRPSPSAGARSALELHIVAGAVDGLEPGAYRYDALVHELTRGRADPVDCAALLAEGRAATGAASGALPPVVIVLSAVVARTCWKYGRLGHRLLQQDLGCMHQTLYLVATALGLAPCAIGALPLHKTAAHLALDPIVEPPLAGFLVGRRWRADSGAPSRTRPGTA